MLNIELLPKYILNFLPNTSRLADENIINEHMATHRMHL
jgi:hypothetical protein